MQAPMVSILMTAYNREDYIASAIDSVLASTYQNFELIIVDDVSTDRTVEIAEKYAANDKRVKVYLNEKNLGDYPNRNQAAAYATGKYLKYIDADDYIYPWGLELLIGMMEKFPTAGWGLCSLDQDDDRPFPFLLKDAEIYKYHYYAPGTIFYKAPLSAIVKKECFDAVGGFSGKKHLGDFELWHILAMKFPVILMPHGIVWYRVHDGQESSANRADPEVPFKYLVSSANFFKNCNEIPVDEATRKDIHRRISVHIIKTILVNVRRGRIAVAYKLYKATTKKEYNFSWNGSKN